MTKYTRREFFKSIIPVSVGVVLFLGDDDNNPDIQIGGILTLDEYARTMDTLVPYSKYLEFPGLDYAINTGKNYIENKEFPNSIRELTKPGETIPYEVSLVGKREPTEDEI